MSSCHPVESYIPGVSPCLVGYKSSFQVKKTQPTYPAPMNEVTICRLSINPWKMLLTPPFCYLYRSSKLQGNCWKHLSGWSNWALKEPLPQPGYHFSMGWMGGEYLTLVPRLDDRLMCLHLDNLIMWDMVNDCHFSRFQMSLSENFYMAYWYCPNYSHSNRDIDQWIYGTSTSFSDKPI